MISNSLLDRQTFFSLLLLLLFHYSEAVLMDSFPYVIKGADAVQKDLNQSV